MNERAQDSALHTCFRAESDRPSRILLVRHGRSAHVHSGWIDAAGFRRWMAAYDAAGISDHEMPPALVQQFAKCAGMIVCSDMIRAKASAEVLARGRPITVSTLLREMEMIPPAVVPGRLPLSGWAVAFILRWMCRGICGEAIPQVEQQRAADAAEWLADIAAESGDVLAVTHGAFRAYLAKALRERGWYCETSRRRHHHWSVWGFRRPPGLMY